MAGLQAELDAAIQGKREIPSLQWPGTQVLNNDSSPPWELCFDFYCSIKFQKGLRGLQFTYRFLVGKKGI